MTAVGDAPLRLAVGADHPVADVRALLTRPERPRAPAVALTHGAGGDLTSSGLEALAHGLAEHGHVTVRFDLPFREAGHKAPPAAEKSVAGYAAAAGSARAVTGADRWAVGGKSYGGRVASMAVAAGLDAVGLIFYGYPLHAPGKRDQPRVDHWPAIRVPTLFLQGTHDALCDLEVLEANLELLGAPATVHVVDGGDHSLAVPGARAPDGRRASQAATLARLGPVVAAWLTSVVAR